MAAALVLRMPVLYLLAAVFSLVLLCCILTGFRRSRSTGHFFIVRKIPFFHQFCLSENADRKYLTKYSCGEIKSLFLKEASHLYGTLEKGTYRTVTHESFARIFRRHDHITVLKEREAFRQSLGKTCRDTYLRRCKSCDRIGCPIQNREAEVRFRYLKFRRD